VSENPAQSPKQREELVHQIASLPSRLEALVSELSPEQLSGTHIPGEWTVAQNVHHVADAHLNGFVRFKLILTEDRPTLKPFDQERWAELLDSKLAVVTRSLLVLKGVHARWVELLRSLDEDEWRRFGYHPEVGIVSLDDLLQTYANHGEAHLAQIAQTLAARGQGS
jgi:hypothetical protein